MFIGREPELDQLRREFDAPRASLMVVYGRRRIGKSALIRQATTGRPHVAYQAARLTPSLNLEAFKTEIARALGPDDLLAAIGDWLGVLLHLANKAESHPGLVILLDEFPYLIDAEPALSSIIQKFWDAGAPQRGRLKLVLCGSLIAHMEDLLAERNPLYGRKTLALELGPLPLREAVKFFPDYAADERLMAYSIFGGVPFYLQLCDQHASLAENVLQLLLTSAGALVDEPTVLLQSELRDIHRYASILSAAADGCTKYGEIIGRIGDTDSRKIAPYIERLERMRLIRAVRSLDATPKSRDRRYFVADPLLTFWYRFVRPNLSSIEEGFGADIWRLQILSQIDDFMGRAFEIACREHARRHAQERLPAPTQEVGQIWGADYDIDIAGRLLDGAVLYGECKWWQREAGESVLATLAERAASTAYGRGNDRRYFLLYARSGFTRELRARAQTDKRVVLNTPSLMLGGK
jgi:AAA+ ATPase superfamily predicted ATPase